MSAPRTCPGCGTALEAQWDNCPNCPLSFAEELPEESPLKSSVLKDFVLPALFLGALAAGVYLIGQKALSLAAAEAAPPPSPDSDAVSPAAERSEDATASPAISGISLPPEFALPAPEAAAPAPSRAAAPRPPLPAPEPAPAPVAEPAPEEEMSAVSIMRRSGGRSSSLPKEWKLRGAVYDLLTFLPLAGCSMTFTGDEADRGAQTMTDAAGRYRILLRPLRGQGYAVAIRKPGYAPTYLNPGANAREMDMERREELTRELAGTIGEAATVEPFGAEPLITDFYLAPLK